jgi:hypothetical protein
MRVVSQHSALWDAGKFMRDSRQDRAEELNHNRPMLVADLGGS